MKARGRYSKSDVETIKSIFYLINTELGLGLAGKFDAIKNDIIYMDESGILKILNKKTLAVVYCMISYNQLNKKLPSLSEPTKFIIDEKIINPYIEKTIPEKIKLEFEGNQEKLKEIKIKQILAFYRYLEIINKFNTFGE